MSSFFRMLGKKRAVPVLNNVETRVMKTMTPGDWLMGGFWALVMTAGVFIMVAEASVALSVEQPLFGGTHREGLVGTPRFINPLLATSETDRDFTALVYGGLMKQTPEGIPAPYLAERYEVSEDGLQYTFYLKEDIFFHDGMPITAEDVVYTIQTAKNPEIKSPRRANWEGVDVIATDTRTVVFTLRAPYGLFIENTTMGILPKHVWSPLTAEEFPFSEQNTDPVGSGMYEITSIKKNASGIPTEYTLTASGNGANRPFIKHFVFVLFNNTEALQSALENGDISGAHSVVGEARASTVIEEAIFARVFGVFFNQNQQELFADATVRRALNQAIDKKQIVAKILGGYGSALSGPLPPDRVQREGDTSESAEVTVLEAQALLEADGWTRGEDGIYQKTVNKREVRRLEFSLATANAPELKQAAELVAESWRALGAEVTLQFFDQNDLNLEVIRPRKYDALLFGLVVGRELDLFAFWHSSQRNDPGLNIALYASITTDKLLEDARNELNPQTRREYALKASEEIAKDDAALFLYAPHFVYAHEKRLRGVSLRTVATPSDRFAGVENWYLETERVWPLFTNSLFTSFNF